jgi:hypothetical protein
MSGFESKNFNKSVSNPQKPLREFNVGMEETQTFPQQMPQQNIPQVLTPEIAAAAKEARREKINQEPRIADYGKKRIEILANIGRLTKDVEIEGYKFSLRTLKAKETQDAAIDTFKSSTQLEASFENRKQLLARSLFQIDGNNIDFVIGSNSISDKISFLEELEECVINKLFDEFSALRTEAESKYNMKTTKEAEEAGEDLKK